MATLPATGYLADSARTEAEMQTAFEALRDVISQLPATAEVQLTISAGTITPATRDQGAVKVETEAAAASDDLANIATTNTPDGTLLLLRASVGGHTVAVKHAAGGAGQILLQYDADFSLNATDKWLLVKRIGSDWVEVFRSYGNDPAAERAAIAAAGTAGATFTGGINEARGTVAMHATTMDLWAQPNIIDGTSTAVTVTAIANAPQAGSRRVLYPVAASVITNGATFAVDGAANATAAAGDAWEFEAITTSTYKVHITKKDGTAISGSATRPRAYLAGLTLSNNATAYEIDVAAGTCRDSTNTVDITLSAAITDGELQSTGAWAAGSSQKKLDTGARANSTWYHVYAIRKDSDGSGDFLYSTSASSPTMPSGYTYFRRIGSVLTNAGTDIVDFSQRGDEFLWDIAVADINAVAPGTAAVTRTLSTPLGVQTIAIINAGGYNGTTNTIGFLVSPLDITDTAPQSAATAALTVGNSGGFGTGATVLWMLFAHLVRTNTSSQIRSRQSASGAADRFGIVTRGWIDSRGRDL